MYKYHEGSLSLYSHTVRPTKAPGPWRCSVCPGSREAPGSAAGAGPLGAPPYPLSRLPAEVLVPTESSVPCERSDTSLRHAPVPPLGLAGSIPCVERGRDAEPWGLDPGGRIRPQPLAPGLGLARGGLGWDLAARCGAPRSRRNANLRRSSPPRPKRPMRAARSQRDRLGVVAGVSERRTEEKRSDPSRGDESVAPHSFALDPHGNPAVMGKLRGKAKRVSRDTRKGLSRPVDTEREERVRRRKRGGLVVPSRDIVEL